MEIFEDMLFPEKLICMKATEQKVPVNGILELTPLCNMNCDMCYVRLSREEAAKQGRIHTVSEWLELAGQMEKAGVIFLLLTGGEPLLYPGFRQLYLALKKMGMILTINTNGTLLDEEWADFFAKNPPRRINITLYGSNANAYDKLCHYAEGFEKSLRAISLLKDRGIAVKINGSLTPANQMDGIELIKLAKSTHMACKIDTYMYPASRERSKPFDLQSRLNPEEAAYARVMLMKEKFSHEIFAAHAQQMISIVECTSQGDEVQECVNCRAGRSSFAINWQGYLRPCIMLMTPSVPVFEMGFVEAWTKIVMETEKIMLNAKCSGCSFREVCQTCVACAMSETGSFNGVPEYMCEYTKETLRLLRNELENIQKVL